MSGDNAGFAYTMDGLLVADTEGALAVILCWHRGYGEESWASVAQMIRRVPKIVKGDFTGLNADQLFFIMDALGGYPERDAALESIYEQADAAWSQANRR